MNDVDVAYCIVRVFRFAMTQPPICSAAHNRVTCDPWERSIYCIAQISLVCEAKAKGLTAVLSKTKPRRSFLLKPLVNHDSQRQTK